MTFAEKLALLDRLIVNFIAIALSVIFALIVFDTTMHPAPTLDPNPVCHLVKP
jgi:hypothetical protein